MNRATILSRLLDTKIIAIIRLNAAKQVYPAALALVEGGVNAIEVTMGTPDALKEIEKLAQHPDILPGVGSVVEAKTVEAAVAAGAQYIVTPSSKKEIIEIAHRLDKPVFSGALTPSEILQAHEWGADVIKLFPAGTFGLPYLKAIQGPMPAIPIMPTGGVSIENAAAWLQQGAVCLGVGSTLVNQELIEQGDYDQITAMAKKMRAVVENTMRDTGF